MGGFEMRVLTLSGGGGCYTEIKHNKYMKG